MIKKSFQNEYCLKILSQIEEKLLKLVFVYCFGFDFCFKSAVSWDEAEKRQSWKTGFFESQNFKQKSKFSKLFWQVEKFHSVSVWINQILLKLVKNCSFNKLLKTFRCKQTPCAMFLKFSLRRNSFWNFARTRDIAYIFNLHLYIYIVARLNDSKYKWMKNILLDRVDQDELRTDLHFAETVFICLLDKIKSVIWLKLNI